MNCGDDDQGILLSALAIPRRRDRPRQLASISPDQPKTTRTAA
jgi:hypothetical protein